MWRVRVWAPIVGGLYAIGYRRTEAEIDTMVMAGDNGDWTMLLSDRIERRQSYLSGKGKTPNDIFFSAFGKGQKIVSFRG